MAHSIFLTNMVDMCKLYINLSIQDNNFLVRHVISLLQYLKKLYLTRKLSCFSPVSPYIIFVYAHLFKESRLYIHKMLSAITVQFSIPRA